MSSCALMGSSPGATAAGRCDEEGTPLIPSRVALVTGGTYGIGRAITMRLAEDGFGVVAMGLDAPQIGSSAADGRAATAHALAERGHAGLVMEGDVADRDDVRVVVNETVTQFGRIDVLVNNAAIHPRGTLLETPLEVWQRVLAVNLTGLYNCCAEVLPHMLRAGAGSIVNVGSAASWGRRNLLAYSTSKGGVFAFTQALARDYSSRGVRVNLVVPGGTPGTGMTRGTEDAGGVGGSHVTGSAFGPENTAGAVSWLASGASTQISGAVLNVGCYAFQSSEPA